MDYIQGFDRKQEILFPAKIDDYIGEENLVHFIEAFVALLDLVGLGFTHAEVNTTGRPSICVRLRYELSENYHFLCQSLMS